MKPKPKRAQQALRLRANKMTTYEDTPKAIDLFEAMRRAVREERSKSAPTRKTGA